MRLSSWGLAGVAVTNGLHATSALAESGSNFDKRRVTLAASSLLEDRTRRITDATPGPNGLVDIVGISPSQKKLAASIVRQLDMERKELKSIHGGYGKASTTTEIISVKALEGGRSEVHLKELTRLYYHKHAPDASPFQEYVQSWIAEVSSTSKGSVIESMTPQIDYGCFAPPTVLPEEYPEAEAHPIEAAVEDLGAAYPEVSRGATKQDGVSPSQASPNGDYITYSTGAKGYSYTSMGAYARVFYQYGNPDYVQWGSDCTNFVSQCMKQGGWQSVSGSYSQRPDNNRWWYNGKYGSSYSWAASQNWRNFGFASGRLVHMSSMWKLAIGDVLGYDYDRNGSLDHLQFCSHNNYGNPQMTQRSGTGTSGAYYCRTLSEIMKVADNANATKWSHGT